MAATTARCFVTSSHRGRSRRCRCRIHRIEGSHPTASLNRGAGAVPGAKPIGRHGALSRDLSLLGQLATSLEDSERSLGLLAKLVVVRGSQLEVLDDPVSDSLFDDTLGGLVFVHTACFHGGSARTLRMPSAPSRKRTGPHLAILCKGLRATPYPDTGCCVGVSGAMCCAKRNGSRPTSEAPDRDGQRRREG